MIAYLWIIPALAGNTNLGKSIQAGAKDHPRSRGEYAVTFCPLLTKTGSSPLSRGIHILVQGMRVTRGIIPALAGNTPRYRGLSKLLTDHPRSRGEYLFTPTRTPFTSGSSPLSRGIPRILERYRPFRRIIPALAGNTPWPARKSRNQRDHPRSRGEYIGRDEPNGTIHGSSPLSRGIHTQPNRTRGPNRIIPALAGNTAAAGLYDVTRPDHPRSRGEYLDAAESDIKQAGSSPLSRGIRRNLLSLAHQDRIIPALAGNTLGSRQNRVVNTDHPRSRGEYASEAIQTLEGAGSSPLSRGIRPCGSGSGATPRIIPALAGNTCRSARTGCGGSDHPRSRGEYKHPHATKTGRDDHPRSRGEYAPWASRSIMACRSSPLSRGILRGVPLPPCDGTIIPALAGNTLVDKGFYQPDLSDLGNPLLARLRFSKSLAPRLRRPPSWRGESSGSASEGPGRTIRVSPS